MTIGVGIRCADGLVLCADSLESDGVTKRNVNKIREVFRNDEWGIVIASAGDADLAECFADDLGDVLADKQDFDEAWFIRTLRKAVQETHKANLKSEFALLVGFYRETKRKTSSRIFRVQQDSAGPVSYWQAVGIGGHLSDFFLSQLYSPNISVAEALHLGVFVIARAKEHVDGCGGPTRAWCWTIGDTQWRPKD
ncbi:MAG: hypothetical protein WA185_08190, partial [Candidatus Acidiferrales bacterium]